MQSDVFGCMDECNMMVVIHTDSRCALTAPSMTGPPSLSQISLFCLLWLLSIIEVLATFIGSIVNVVVPTPKISVNRASTEH